MSEEEDIIKAFSLLSETTEEEEERVLRRLLWCLNASDRRRWLIKARPDKITRNIPSTDYICEEEKKGTAIN